LYSEDYTPPSVLGLECAAPTSGELILDLPLNGFFTVYRLRNGQIRIGNPLDKEERFEANTFVNALAKMKIYLLKSKQLNIKDI